MASLTTQLLTVSVLSLQRQLYHNRGLRLTESSSPRSAVWWNSSYDFIIVGGGTAGCILATRLTENPRISVLLIEEGGPQTVITDIIQSTPVGSDDIVQFYSVPQRYSSRAYTDQRVYYPGGRILGGSSAINNAVYNRGNARIYDEWSRVYGAHGWTYRDVLPYFLKSENQTDPAIMAAYPGYHSTSGPIQVSTIAEPDPIFLRWTEAVEGAGWPRVDFNGPNIMQTTQFRSNWTRASTASAFIEPNIDRPNLHILLRSKATRILFNQKREAIGVKFSRKDGHTHQVHTRRELIISCGTLQTPPLLMLSGIGPRDHLTQLDIPVVADLPVGNNLIDHIIVMMDAFVRNPVDIPLRSDDLDTSFTFENLYQLIVNHQGPLTRDPISETYFGTGINGDQDFPDVVMYFQSLVIGSNLTEAVKRFNVSQREEWRQYTVPIAGNPLHISLSFNNFRPLSRGTLRLSSADPFTDPVIDPNFFSNPRDLAALVRGMQIGFRLAELPLMQPYLKIHHVRVPGCEFCTHGPQRDCLPYLRCIAQTVAGSTGHHVGTCRMGNATSREAVVDERLRVLGGVGRLRVVDASIMPTAPNANPNAAVIMIAERGADFIRQDNNL